MKKVTDFLKPNILIVFGALLFLYFLNYLSLQGAGLAIGIVAVILSAYYIAIGVLGVVLANRLPAGTKKIFEVVSVSLFGLFMFVLFLLTTISCAKIEGYMGPTAWTIAILSMIAALAMVGIYVTARFVKKDSLMRLAYLFSAIFALALLLNILFDAAGNGIVLGAIDLLLTAIYLIFCVYLFGTLKPENAPAPAPEKVEEKKDEEEAPAEEEKAE